MAFVAPLIGAALSLGAVGTAIVGAAISIGAGYLARKLAPSPRDLGASSAGMRLSLRYDPNAEREVAFGRCASAGTLVYQQVYGPNGNDFAQLVFALADHECDALEGVFVNGTYHEPGEPTAQTWVTGSPVAPLIWAKFHAGAWEQTADADLVARSGGAWTANHRGRGVCYVRVTMLYDPEVFADGMPRFLFVFRGIRLYDPRKDSTVGGAGAHRWGETATYEWTANPAVCLYNWRRGIFVGGERMTGMATPAAALPLDDWMAAMNACDETVNRKDGSGSDPRYRLHGIIGGDENRAVIRAMLAAMAGEEIDSGGVVKLLPGVAQAPVLSITDDDLLLEAPVEITPRRPRSELVNAVLGSFHDPQSVYQSMALAPRISPDDEAADGGVRLAESYALDLVSDQRQGQRVLEILRRKARHQRRARVPLRSSCAILEAGDWISWTSARYGFVDMLFMVEEAPLGDDLTLTAALREVSAGIFAWDPATDELDPLDPAELPSGGASFATITGLSAENITVPGGAGVERPGLYVEWDAVDDLTVTRIIAEYRRVGDTAGLTVEIYDPGAGSHAWVEGVQGGTTYEVRLLPVTMPPRPVSWSGWVSTGSAAGGQVVATAVIAQAVPADTITAEMLSAQVRFEVGLATAVAAVQGSVASQLQEAFDQAQRAGEAALAAIASGADNQAQITTERIERVNEAGAFAQQITTLRADLDDAAAALVAEQTARSDGDTALAEDITTAVTQIGDNTAAISEVITSVDGLKAGWGVAINVNKQVVGLVRLDGEEDESTFTMVADKVVIAHPDVDGGTPIPVFTITEIEGADKLHFAGELIANAIRAGEVSAETVSSVFASFGHVRAGKIESSDAVIASGKRLLIDADNPRIRMERTL